MTRFITAAATACACLALATPAAEARSKRHQATSAETRSIVAAINAKLRRYVHPTGKCPLGYSERLATNYWQDRHAATGERFNPDGLTAAHRTLSFGTLLHIINPHNGRSATVRVNDRGPYTIANIDLARRAARAIGMTTSIFVCVSVTDP
jgi:rare lipoprotein A